MNELLNILLEDKDIFKPRDRKKYEEEAKEKLSFLDEVKFNELFQKAFVHLDQGDLLDIFVKYIEPSVKYFLIRTMQKKLSRGELEELYIEYIVKKEE